MSHDTGRSKRRKFHWPSEAAQLVRAQGHQSYSSAAGRAGKREQVISRLIQMSGNPRGACLRFMRRFGLAPQRSYREWTTGERRRLIELIEEVPVREAAKILRRSPPSIRSMLHRLGLGARQSREWFTVSLLAQALHISRSEVQKWIDRGWLQCRVVQVQSVTRKIIDAEDFCLFVKNHGQAVIGNRVLSEKSIVLSWAILKWSVQSDRYGDVSILGCRSIPRSIVNQQSRLECSEFRCNGAWDTMYPGQSSE